ncbi:MAG: L,D-transpeptidase family protein [Nitrospirae bacterium]|nr:L,D-transpeptidase family protein [Nitrospirota bacterium]
MFTGISHLLVALIIIIPASAGAGEYVYDKDATIIGKLATYIISDNNESLIELARKFDIGYNEIVEANPGLDPFVPGAGSFVIMPTSWILPDIKVHEGIVINLSELRLYYFFAKGKQSHIVSFPIGIGSQGKETPVGSFRIVEKIANPSWHVPASIRKEDPELPPFVPAGPDNPMGTHALRLSLQTVLIHGTNRPFAVGRKASHGCLRLYPEDIPKLFKMVKTGTQVTIVRQPIKTCLKQGKVYMEVHKDDTIKPETYYKTAIDLLAKKHLLDKIDSGKFFRALRDMSGVPVDISPDASEDNLPAGVALEENALREDRS